jgi:predicted ABC-type sugar transport system permease subunit
MNDKTDGGDSISVGNITSAQGVAIGRQATASVTGDNVASDILDPIQLKTILEGLQDALGAAKLPGDHTREAQTAARNAIAAVSEKEFKPDSVVGSVKKIADTLKQADVAVKEGTSLWESVQKLATLIGPLVGGARVVAAWFGIPF